MVPASAGAISTTGTMRLWIPASLMRLRLSLKTDRDLALLIRSHCRWLRPFGAPPHGLDLQSQQVGLDVTELRASEAAHLFGLRSQNVHILTNDLATDRFEQQPDEWRNPAEAESNHRVHVRLVL